MNNDLVADTLQEYFSKSDLFNEVKIIKSNDPTFLGRINRGSKPPVNVYMAPDMEFDITVGEEDIAVYVPQPNVDGWSDSLVLAMMSGVLQGISEGLEECGL